MFIEYSPSGAWSGAIVPDWFEPVWFREVWSREVEFKEVYVAKWSEPDDVAFFALPEPEGIAKRRTAATAITTTAATIASFIGKLEATDI